MRIIIYDIIYNIVLLYNIVYKIIVLYDIYNLYLMKS